MNNDCLAEDESYEEYYGEEMKNGIHTHFCHICLKEFECSTVTHCSIEDRYAVCYSRECIKEFECSFEEGF